MVNYSIVMRSNPMDADAAKKAYASAQYSEVMDINRFAEHIASHGCARTSWPSSPWRWTA